jgi:hypothetical protein
MQKTTLFLSALGAVALLVAPGSAQSKKAVSKPTQDSVVITFKDGHSQSYLLADVDKIEFESAEPAQANGSSGHFLGKWKVDNGGGNFTITLKRDGHASKYYNGYRDNGTWQVVGDEARITWQDGWRDTIRKAGSRYENAARRPGRTFTDPPDSIVDANSTEPI